MGAVCLAVKGNCVLQDRCVVSRDVLGAARNAVRAKEVIADELLKSVVLMLF